jgi:hypothetical protein
VWAVAEVVAVVAAGTQALATDRSMAQAKTLAKA